MEQNENINNNNSEDETKIGKNEDKVSLEGKFIQVCSFNEIKSPGNRKRVVVLERDITLFNIEGEIHAMDSVCYHLGGPLEEGDIEDFGGKNCVVCPWHRYKLDLETGEGLYSDMKGAILSKGKKQRVHKVKVEDGQVYVYGFPKEAFKEKMASDDYAYKELYKIKKSDLPAKRVHSSLPPRSGNVFQNPYQNAYNKK